MSRSPEGPIGELRHIRTVHNRSRLPTAWVGGLAAALEWSGGHWLSDTAEALPEADAGFANKPVLLLLRSIWPAIVAAVRRYVAAGARIYILVDEGERGVADLLKSQAPTRIIVRHLAGIPATAIYTQSMAWLWLSEDLTLRLADEQVERLRLFFLRLFWHESSQQIHLSAEGTERTEVAERPFDVPPLGPSSPLHLLSAEESMRWLRADSRIFYLRESPLPERAHILWCPVVAHTHQALAQRLEAGTAQILCSNWSLPEVQLSDTGGALLFSGPGARLLVRLYAPQAQELAQLLEQAPPTWRFAVDVLADPQSDPALCYWLPDEAQGRPAQQQQQISLGSIQAPSIRATTQTQPPLSLPPPDPLIAATHYEWWSAPPRLPVGAQRDPLDAHWAHIEGFLRERIVCIQRVSDQLETYFRASALFPLATNKDVARLRPLHQRIRQDIEQRLHQSDLQRPEALPHLLVACEDCVGQLNALSLLLREVSVPGALKAIDWGALQGLSGPPYLPTEARPSVGQLWQHTGRRYLVITRWRELDEGEREAARLGAHLVAPELLARSGHSEPEG